MNVRLAIVNCLLAEGNFSIQMVHIETDNIIVLTNLLT